METNPHSQSDPGRFARAVATIRSATRPVRVAAAAVATAVVALVPSKGGAHEMPEPFEALPAHPVVRVVERPSEAAVFDTPEAAVAAPEAVVAETAVVVPDTQVIGSDPRDDVPAGVAEGISIQAVQPGDSLWTMSKAWLEGRGYATTDENINAYMWDLINRNAEAGTFGDPIKDPALANGVVSNSRHDPDTLRVGDVVELVNAPGPRVDTTIVAPPADLGIGL